MSWIYADCPEYGRRLKTSKVKKWRDIHGQRGISVNLRPCIRSPACSILIHPNADQFCHVWEIQLDVLNGHLTHLNDGFVAQYKPVDDNKCHFELMVLNGSFTPTEIVVLLDHLERSFPPPERDPPKGSRPPVGAEESARTAAREYGAVVEIHHDPLNKLQPAN